MSAGEFVICPCDKFAEFRIGLAGEFRIGGEVHCAAMHLS